MKSDEELYKLAANELKESPRQGLLIKCISESEGNEQKGNALYIKTRVAELSTDSKKLMLKEGFLKSRYWIKNIYSKYFPNKKALEHVSIVGLLYSWIVWWFFLGSPPAIAPPIGMFLSMFVPSVIFAFLFSLLSRGKLC